MPNADNVFFSLLRFSIHEDYDFTENMTDAEWVSIYRQAQRQALIGILFQGVERLPTEKRPPKKLVLEWYAAVEHIKKINTQINRDVVAITAQLKQAGFRSTLLKGQGIALLYPNPLRRQPGDIDLWVEGKREHIVQYMRDVTASHLRIMYHHTDWPKREGFTDVEVHFLPTFLHDPLHNARLQKFFSQEKKDVLTNSTVLSGTNSDIQSPTLKFNRIFILAHIYRHFLTEGVGLKQLLDYYYVLRAGFTLEEKAQTMRVIEQIGLKGFIGAVMHLLYAEFGLNRECLLCQPNEKYGRILLDECLKSGNMGQYKERSFHKKTANKWKRFVSTIHNNFHLIKLETSEIIWYPFFRIWHFLWKWIHGYR